MPVVQALLFSVSIVAIAVATRPGRLHPFLAIVLVATVFGLAAGLPAGLLGKAFGAGFSQAIYAPGLVLIAAGLVGGVVERSAAPEWLTAKINRRRPLGRAGMAACLGLIAGLGASPATAFALAMPLLRAVSGGKTRPATAVTPALAISASHGLLLFSPVPIAAASIFDASWSDVIRFGLPLAIVLIAFGAAWAHWLAGGTTSQPSPQHLTTIVEKRGRRSAITLVAAIAVPLLMLIVQSLGDIPSEPLGGGPAREMVLAVGRPLILSLVALAIVVAGLPRLSSTCLGDSIWTGRTLGNVAGILLIVGAAGGLQRLCQETGMAELLGEKLLGWHVRGLAGLFVPFVVAAVIKTLQGSSLVAAIAAAGMVQPILIPLGLGGDNGKALATLAIGAGAMTVAHVNDEFFWLVCGTAGLQPTRGLVAFSAGTLAQGLVALAALLALAALVSAV